MKKIYITIALLAATVAMPADANAQGFLKKLKQKAEAAMQMVAGKDSKDADADADAEDEGDDDDNIMKRMTAAPEMPSGTDVVPKQRTITFEWDGTVTPSKASTITALYAELPSLPTAEKMARSTEEERNAYYQKLSSVLAKIEQLQKAKECTDAELIAARDRLMNKYQDMYGLTAKEMAILQDENAPQAQKEAIMKKVAAQEMGIDIATLETLQSVPEDQREAYVRQHPEIIQKIMSGAMANAARNQKYNGAQIAMTHKMVEIGKRMNELSKYAQSYNCDAYITKYDNRLKSLVEQIFQTDDQPTVDRLNDEVDDIIANYRTEVARTYRTHLQKIITDARKIADDQHAAIQKWASQEGLPACVGDIALYNGIISVGNNLGKAFMELPDLHYYPVKKERLYKLPEGWEFCEYECGFPYGRGAMTASGGGSNGNAELDNAGKTIACQWPLLIQRVKDDGTYEHAVLECEKIREIDEQELDQINRKVKVRRNSKAKGATAFGKYKSRNGKREIVYENSGELVINGMYSFTPILFSKSAERLEWIMFDNGEIVKCTYKL